MANEKKGRGDHSFQLITKSMEGPWGTGSKQAIDLIFEDEVWALVGSHDGRNAHLVEQAATKSTIVFVSAWSSDPTLSQAFVPWFFNSVPTDRQQADALIEEIYIKRKISRVAIISDQSYDSNMALKNYLQSVQQAGKVEPWQFLYNNSTDALNILVDQILNYQVKAIILFCHPSASLKVVRLLQQRKINQPVFGPLSILNEDVLSMQELLELSTKLLVPSMPPTSVYQGFYQAYQKAYGKKPGMVAAFSFDAMNVLIEAIRISGSPDHEKIQQALSAVCHEGVTGRIEFDNRGNRKGIPSVSSVKIN